VNEARALYQNLHDYTAPESITSYWVEDHLDHSHLTRTIDALFGISTDIESRSFVTWLAEKHFYPQVKKPAAQSLPTQNGMSGSRSWTIFLLNSATPTKFSLTGKA